MRHVFEQPKTICHSIPPSFVIIISLLSLSLSQYTRVFSIINCITREVPLQAYRAYSSRFIIKYCQNGSTAVQPRSGRFDRKFDFRRRKPNADSTSIVKEALLITALPPLLVISVLSATRRRVQNLRRISNGHSTRSERKRSSWY